MKNQLPRQRYLFSYAVVGACLLTIIPFQVTLDHLREASFGLRVVSLIQLVVLEIAILYGSLRLNLYLYKKSLKTVVFLNLLAFVVFSSISIAIHYPIWSITPLEQVRYYVRDELGRDVIIFITSYMSARYYLGLKEREQLAMAVSALEKENLKSQLNGLMQQVNPHFLFNALNTLSGLIAESREKSEEYVNKLAKVLRYVLSLEGRSLLPLDEELRFMDDYLYLMHIKFEDKLIVNVHYTPMPDCMVVPLCTQLLLENIVKHNVISRRQMMQVDIDVNRQYLTITNLYHPKAALESHHVGLQNLNRRCMLIAERPIIVKQTDDTFSVSVPVIQNSNPS